MFVFIYLLGYLFIHFVLFVFLRQEMTKHVCKLECKFQMKARNLMTFNREGNIRSEIHEEIRISI